MKYSRTLIIAFGIALFLPVFGAAENSLTPEVRISNNDDGNYQPQAAYNTQHHEFFVVWHVSSFQGRYVMGKRVDSFGNIIAEYTIAFEDSPPRDNIQPTVAYDPNNDRYLVAWLHDTNGDGSDWDIQGRLVPWNGPTTSLYRFNICIWTSKQWNPRVAFAGTQREFLVTWWNEGTGGVASYISAVRIDASTWGVGQPFTVASGTEERVTPDVAYNQARNEYLIVYQVMDGGGGDVAAVRMNAGGSILGGGEFGIAGWPDPETSPRVAASQLANQWLVVWQSDTGSPNLLNIYGRRVWVDGLGAIQQSVPVLINDSYGTRRPEIACDPGSRIFGISWEQPYVGGNFGIWARTMDTSDRLGDNTTVQTVYTGETIDSKKPGMAASPQGFLTVYMKDRQNSSAIDIYGRVMWQLFSDGFESGDVSRWSSVSP